MADDKKIDEELNKKIEEIAARIKAAIPSVAKEIVAIEKKAEEVSKKK